MVIWLPSLLASMTTCAAGAGDQDDDKQYSCCVKSCATSCRDISLSGGKCNGDCLQGCTCKPGNYLDQENNCVPQDQCNCYSLEDPYTAIKPGAKVTIGCQEW